MAKESTASTSQIRNSSRLRVEPQKHHAHHSTRVHQDQPRSTKNPRTIVPPPQSARIMQRYISGESLRKIAQAEHRDRATVSKIVKSTEVAEYIEALREKFYGSLEIAMDTLLDELRNPNSKTRAWLAFKMLEHGAVIPCIGQAMEAGLRAQQPAPESEEVAIKRIAVSMLEGAIERHRFYGLPLPEADEAERALLAKEKENSGRRG